MLLKDSNRTSEHGGTILCIKFKDKQQEPYIQLNTKNKELLGMRESK
jgi:hypothetical protein